MSDAKKSGVSFGFSKTKEKKTLTNNAINNDEPGELKNQPDFLRSVEDKSLQSTKPKEEVGELIIPLIQTNRYRLWKPGSDQDEGDDISESKDSTNRGKSKATGTDELPSVDSTTDAAVRELLREATQGPESREGSGSDLSIPLMMRNKVPEGYETDDKLDVSLRPDEAAGADYDQVPIDSFGVALLRGMGWKPGQGIGRNNKAVKPPEAILRPKGLGLGADKSLAQQAEGVKKNSASKDDVEEELELKAKTHCLVHRGKHEGLYGVVEGLDSDNARVMVLLTLSGEKVTLSQYAVKPVSAKEHKKYSKYLNKSKVDKLKEEQSRGSGSDSESKHHKHKQRHRESEKDRHRDRSRSRSHSRESSPHRHRHRERSRSRDRDSEHRHGSDKKRKHKEDRSSNQCKKSKHRDLDDRSSSSGHHGNSGAPWMRPDLRVRLVDPNYKKGKYFKKKVIIEDVVSLDTCICRTDEGKVLEGVTQSMLETVIPKTEPSYVMLVTGKHKGQLAEILRKDKSACKASINLLSDRDNVHSVDYDHICEYTGDINSAFDY